MNRWKTRIPGIENRDIQGKSAERRTLSNWYHHVAYDAKHAKDKNNRR